MRERIPVIGFTFPCPGCCNPVILDPLNGRITEFFDSSFRVGCTEDSRTGDDNLSSGGDHRFDVRAVDPAVDLDTDVQLPIEDQLSQPFDLVQRLRNELLSPKTRVH